MELKIRRAEAVDLEAIARLEAECFPPSEADSLEMIEMRSNLLAELDGRVVGYINSLPISSERLDDRFYTPNPPIDRSAEGVALMSLGVEEKNRRRGIASALINESIERTTKKFLVLVCKREKVEYYRKFGFECVGVSNVTLGGERWFDMRLKLEH